MATVVRNTHPTLAVVCAAHNGLKAQIGAGSFFHLDACERLVTAADSTDLPTALVLCNAIRETLVFHKADLLALKAADATTIGGVATDLTTAVAAANLHKSGYNTHIASTAAHYNADETNAVATTDATNLATLLTLLNAVKGKINAHIVSAPTCPSLRLVQA